MIEPCYPIWLRKLALWVTFGDDSKCFTKGYGSLEIGNVVIENISLVDGLKHNLLSVSQFTDKGYEVNFKIEQSNIINKKDKKLALQGVRKGNLFMPHLFPASKVKLDVSTTKLQQRTVDFGTKYYHT